LADSLRQRIDAAAGLAHEHRPELAIIEQRFVELGLGVVAPAFVDGLQPRRGLEQKAGFKLSRIGRLPRYVFVRLGRALHCRTAPARRRSVSWLPSNPCRGRLLRFDY